MAVVSRVPAVAQQRRNPLRFGAFSVFDNMSVGGGSSSSSSSRRSNSSTIEIEGDESVARVMNEKIFVAVGKPVKEFKSVLVWALHNCGGKRICIIYVHQPAQMIPLMGTKFPASALKEQEVRAYREVEKQAMYKMLDEYLLLCRQMGVRAEPLYVEMDSIEKGILELISLHGIRKLVMGAAAEKRHSRNMMDIKSKKASFVRQKAPPACHIWFVCKGHLIHTREGRSDETDVEVRSSLQQGTPYSELEQSSNSRSRPVAAAQTNFIKLTNPAQDLLRRFTSLKISGHGGSITSPCSPDDFGRTSTLWSKSDTEGSSDEGDMSSRRSISQWSVLSSCSSNGMVHVASGPLLATEGSEYVSELSMEPQSMADPPHSSPPNVLDRTTEDPLFDQIEQAMDEAASSRREAFEEASRRSKAEKEALEAMRKVRASESLYTEESKQRKKVEEALMKEKEALERMKHDRDEVMEELQIAMDQKSLLESQIEETDMMVKQLEQKIISAVELLQTYKDERDELQEQRDNALKEAEELRRSRAEASNSHIPQFFSEFCFLDIKEATDNFDPSLKIGEGGYGSIYKGLLRHTQVAIKMLNPHSLQGPSEFQQEVTVLSRMRHPNLVTLVGACSDAWTLVYEYLPNGSLEDRLSCKGNSAPLSWQTRIRIATELCSVLIFLHSGKPEIIVHGDLKPANILLDANFVSKLSDFGICRLLRHIEGSNSTTVCRTDPKGTFAYIDPEFLSSGELTSKSDVYSFGIILLRLLTGRPPLGIVKEVQYALGKGNLKDLLDPLAGEWPFVLAEQLTNLALRCCEMNRKCRPELATDVWRALEPMKASCGGSSYFRFGSEEHCQPPSYFICPIFQEVMKDPHVAADGFTYEAEALRGWLDSGHDKSPMTNLTLTHTNLVPNHALRSAIQEWLQQQ